MRRCGGSTMRVACVFGREIEDEGEKKKSFGGAKMEVAYILRFVWTG